MKVHGYATIVEPEKRIVEFDVLTCHHCQRQIFVKPRTGATVYLRYNRRTHMWREDAGSFCRQCMEPVCLSCHVLGTCTPWEQQLDRMEARDRLRRSVGV